jgi:hypothetical protein
VRRKADDLVLTLAEKGAAPDCDFVLRWSENEVE